MKVAIPIPERIIPTFIAFFLTNFGEIVVKTDNHGGKREWEGGIVHLWSELLLLNSIFTRKRVCRTQSKVCAVSKSSVDSGDEKISVDIVAYNLDPGRDCWLQSELDPDRDGDLSHIPAPLPPFPNKSHWDRNHDPDPVGSGSESHDEYTSSELA